MKINKMKAILIAAFLTQAGSQAYCPNCTDEPNPVIAPGCRSKVEFSPTPNYCDSSAPNSYDCGDGGYVWIKEDYYSGNASCSFTYVSTGWSESNQCFTDFNNYCGD